MGGHYENSTTPTVNMSASDHRSLYVWLSVLRKQAGFVSAYKCSLVCD